MRDFTAARVGALAPSGIRKVNEKALAMERAGERVIHFEIGRPDFDTPAYIKEAAARSLRDGEVFYTSNFGMTELREAIAERLRAANGIPCAAENVLVTAGLSEAVFDLLCTVLDEGDELLIPDPVWINYLNVPALFGAKPVSYSLTEENGFEPSLEEMRAKITPRTKAIVLLTPCNPTGGVLSRAKLEAIAALAKERDLLVISDEIYERLVYDGEKQTSIASLPGMAERTVTLNGFSKAYSMTGWRIGYAAAPKDLIIAMNKIHQHNTTCAASFVQRAAITALRDEKDEVELMVREFQRRRDYAVKAINDMPGALHQRQGARPSLRRGRGIPARRGENRASPGQRLRRQRRGLSAHELRQQPRQHRRGLRAYEGRFRAARGKINHSANGTWSAPGS